MTDHLNARVSLDTPSDIWISCAAYDPADVPTLFRSGVSLLGAVVWFDVREPQVRPVFRIEDWDAARFWLEPLVGVDVIDRIARHVRAYDAGTLLELLGEPVEDLAPLELDIRMSTDIRRLHRLATGHWLLRFLPSGLGLPTWDRQLLAAEVATVAADLDPLLLSVQHADGMLAGLVPWLAAESASADPACAWVAQEATRAAQALGVNGVRAVASDAVTTAGGPGRRGSVPDGGDLDVEIAALFNASNARGAQLQTQWQTGLSKDAVALAAGGDEDGGGRQLLVLDWERVKPGTVDVRQGQSVTHIDRFGSDGGPDTVEVAVSVQVTDGGEDPELTAHVFGVSMAEQLHALGTITMGRLALGSGQFLGAGSFSVDPNWDLLVDVVDAAVRPVGSPWFPDEVTARQQDAWDLVANRIAHAEAVMSGGWAPPSPVADGWWPFASELVATDTGKREQ